MDTIIAKLHPTRQPDRLILPGRPSGLSRTRDPGSSASSWTSWATIKADVGATNETVWLIDWKNSERSQFTVAEEVTVRDAGQKAYSKRSNLVLYVNGIALGVNRPADGRARCTFTDRERRRTTRTHALSLELSV